MTSPVVIDISHWQPTPDFGKVKANGVVGVMMKCTQGTGYVDPTYGMRANDAASHGLLVCPYHFLEAGNIKSQMDWFLERADPPEGGRVVIDHEPYSSKGVDKTPSLDELCDAVQILLEDARDLQVTIYSGNLIKEQLGSTKTREILTDTSLWIAQYNNTGPSWPKQQWPAWSLWQYTDKANVPGIEGPVDGNKWNGSDQALVSFLSPAGAAAVTPPRPEPDDGDETLLPEDLPVVILDVKVSMSEPVRLRLIVNGEELVTSAAPIWI